MHDIPQPKNVRVKGGILKFNSNFSRKYTEKFNAAQKFIDSEVLRNMAPFTPHLTGNLINSSIRATRIGTGEVNQSAVYAHRRYLSSRINGSRGPQWFERMKAVSAKAILAGARRIING